MSYQVLARKWRPQNFQQMVGQEHVLKALANALDQDRLHHAYLFSGTRGVGKTTIARIFAKSLNCEQGITSDPCGHCTACTEIVEGRFVDLIEIDAASRTKVEDMRELLDNVQYAPTRSRYKIYLIDEVHMLSNSSFNALLKTLEEPPPHIKFLLATTDPQKLPVTVLSRCLQFNLKNLSPERIVKHLAFILEQEQVNAEDPALWELAKAADGSMRDALSLTDQCIAFGNGAIKTKDVLEMLGTIEKHVVLDLLELVAAGNAGKVLDKVASLADFSPDYAFILQAMGELLHRVAIEQVVPGAIDNSFGDQQQVNALAQQMTAEDTQLYYEIALISRRDIALAPDPRTGFEMALLRMLTFSPHLAPPLQKAKQSDAPAEGSSLAETDKITDGAGDDGAGSQVSSTENPSDKIHSAEVPAAEIPTVHNSGDDSEKTAEYQLPNGGGLLQHTAEVSGHQVLAENEKLPSANNELADQPSQSSGDGSVGTSSNPTSDPSLDLSTEPSSDLSSEPSSDLIANSPPDNALPPLDAYTDAVSQIEQLPEIPHATHHWSQQNTGPENTGPENTGSKADTGGASVADNKHPAFHKSETQRSGLNEVDIKDDDEADHTAEAELELPPDLDVSSLGQSGSQNSAEEPLIKGQRWAEVIGQLNLKGMTYSLSQRLVLTSALGERLEFTIDDEHYDFFNQLQQNRLSDSLSEFMGKTVRLVVKQGSSDWLSPLREIELRQAELQTAAEREIHEDQNIRRLMEVFDASVVDNSIEPVIKNNRAG